MTQFQANFCQGCNLRNVISDSFSREDKCLDAVAARSTRTSEAKIRNMMKAHDLLKRFQLKKTRIRFCLVLHFLETQSPQSHQSVMESLKASLASVDAVTLYRNLVRLVSLGLLHKLPDNQYILCSHLCSKKTHIIFSCRSCDRLWEVHSKVTLDVLSKSMAHECEIDPTQPLFFQGLCKECMAKAD